MKENCANLVKLFLLYSIHLWFEGQHSQQLVTRQIALKTINAGTTQRETVSKEALLKLSIASPDVYIALP